MSLGHILSPSRAKSLPIFLMCSILNAESRVYTSIIWYPIDSYRYFTKFGPAQKARSDGPVEVSCLYSHSCAPLSTGLPLTHRYQQVPTSKMPEPEQVIKLSNATPCGTIIVERTRTHSCSLRSTDFPLHPCATLLVMEGSSFGVVGCVVLPCHSSGRASCPQSPRLCRFPGEHALPL